MEGTAKLLQGLVMIGLTLMLGACGGGGGNGGDSTVTAIAKQMVRDSLRSPSSFAPVSVDVKWKGVDQEGRPAYIVRVEYDAQNGFGANLRGCSLAAFALVDDKGRFMESGLGLDDCTAGGAFSEEQVVDMARRANDFVDAAASAPPAPTRAPEPAAAPAPAARTTPPSEEAETSYAVSRKSRYGEIAVKHDNVKGDVALIVNGIRMPNDFYGDIPGFDRSWSIGARDVFLMTLRSGGVGCPSMYFFVIVEKGAASVSQAFGSCSDLPEASLQNGVLTVTFPPYEGAPGVAVRYDNGQVTAIDGGKQTRVPVDRVGI